MSDRLRVALVIALSIPTAYGITLAMDWQEPHWAGFAIGACSLSTMGESVFKALQRFAGTLVAIVIALVLIATLAQQRWAYGLAVSLWLAFCTWRLLNTERYYFWFCAGFIVPLLSIMSHLDSATSFYIVENRAKETLLGILCYIGYALLLMPRDSARRRFEALIAEQLGLVRERIDDIRDHARLSERSADARLRSERIARGLATLPSLHQAAALESIAIRERLRAWRALIHEFDRLNATLDRLDLSFALRGGRTTRADAEELEATLVEFAARIEAISGILLHEGADREPHPAGHLAAEREVSTAHPFHEGEILLRRDALAEIDRTTREMRAWALDITDRQRRPEPPRPAELPTLLPDPEPLRLVLWQFMAFWTSFLIYIYVPSLPDGQMVLILSTVLAMNLVRVPWSPPSVLFVAIFVACVYAGIAHVFVMPHLSGFTELAVMLFAFIFLIAWLFHAPEQQPSRMIGCAYFLMCIQVSNTGQQYSATYIMNLVVAIGVIVLMLHALHSVPLSWRPEAVIGRLLRRYAAAMTHLLDGMRWDAPGTDGWFARQRRHYHLRQLLLLPGQIGTWVNHLPAGAASAEGQAALRQFADRLAVLSHRLADLARLRTMDADPALVALIGAEVRAWRESLQAVIANLLHRPSAVEEQDLRQRLDAMIVRLDAGIAAAVQEGRLQAEPAGIAHMQRVLSAYLGVSDALISAAARARDIAWRRLAEPRF